MESQEEKTLLRGVIVFLKRPGEVLLAWKTTKIGANRWNGYGGGIEEGETPEAAAVRELFEESGVVADPADLRQVACARFHNTKTDGLTFTAELFIYFLWQWEGEPQDSEVMIRPTWFKDDELPFAEMLAADVVWLPRVLAGELIEVEAYYGPFQKELLRPVTVKRVAGFS